MFHRVTPEADVLFPEEMDARRFEVIMAAVASTFNVIALPEAVERMRNGTLPPRAVAVTFDDGYADNHSVALPILVRLGLPATFFVSSGFLDGGMMWNDEAIEAIRSCPWPRIDLSWMGLPPAQLTTMAEKRAAIELVLGKLKYLPPDQRATTLGRLRELTGTHPARDLMMTSEQVRSLARFGMEVGGHTLRHPILAVLSEEEALREVVADRTKLTGILGSAPRLFAYPNGKPGVDYLPAHVEMARSLGYVAAFSTVSGSAGRDTDPFQIPRFTPWDRSPTRFMMRLAHNFGR